MVYNLEQIKQILPHREPILLVSTVEELVPGQEITTTFYVDPSMEIFKGHFPGNPVFPGVYTSEAMGQTTDILFMVDPKYAGKVPLLLGNNNFRFKKMVKPGDTLVIKGKFLSERPEKAIVSAYLEASVDGEVAVSGEVTIAMR